MNGWVGSSLADFCYYNDVFHLFGFPHLARERTPTRIEAKAAPPEREFQPGFQNPSEKAGEGRPFRPVNRPPMAVLVVVDDGGTTGCTVRLLKECTTIGREGTDVEVPHDGLISRLHAAVLRKRDGGRYRWYLEDRDSSNGTFVRVAKTRLRQDQEFLLGSRRFRYLQGSDRVSTEENDEQSASMATQMWKAVSQEQLESAIPRLVEQRPDGSDGEVILFDREQVVIGNGQHLADRIEDPFMDSEHAQASRTRRGHWVIDDLKSLNGLWIKVSGIELVSRCEFQVGEQRILFQPIP